MVAGRHRNMCLGYADNLFNMGIQFNLNDFFSVIYFIDLPIWSNSHKGLTKVKIAILR